MQDRKFFLLALQLERATDAELGFLMSIFDELFKKYTAGGVITDQQALTSGINKLVDKFFKEFVELNKDSAEKVANARAEQALTEIYPMLRKAGLFKDAIDLYQKTKNYSTDVRKRLMVGGYEGKSLGFRIKTIHDGTQKTVQDIIANGTAEGKSARDIAKDIRQYVKPVDGVDKIAPYDEYRKRFGRPKATPKGRPVGTVQYNALRIARTETAHIYRTASLDFYEKREWVKGFGWYLSNRHPATDQCDTYSKQIYKTRDDVPFAHPQCLCDIRPILMTAEELRKLAKTKVS